MNEEVIAQENRWGREFNVRSDFTELKYLDRRLLVAKMLQTTCHKTIYKLTRIYLLFHYQLLL
ncbi:hypothetical protein D3C73_814230 [compost metagenome]